MMQNKAWINCRIGDIAIYINGRAFKPTEWEETGKPIIRIQNLNNPKASYNYSTIEFDDKYKVKHGDLLFAWSASLGAYIWHGQEALLNQHIFKVIPFKGVEKRFIYYLLQYITAQLYAKSHGSGMVHITKGKFENSLISLAPLNEQHRIVTKIEELFSKIDKGVESLQKAKELLVLYRQSLLKNAFEGKLTEQWRKENPDKVVPADELLEQIKQARESRYQQQLEEWESAAKLWESEGKKGKKPSKPKPIKPLPMININKCDLANNWLWVRLGDLFQVSPQNGIYKPASSYGEGYSIIRIDDFYGGKLIKKDGFKKIKLSKEEISTYSLEKGDILINRVNSIEYVGKCCEVKCVESPIVFESNIMRLKILNNVALSSYIVMYLSSHKGKEGISSNAKHAVNQASINQTDVAMTPLPICEITEQKMLVDILTVKLNCIEEQQENIDIILKQSAILKQSILKKAFSGQLVPQDPNDEPASVLLERIRAEKARAGCN